MLSAGAFLGPRHEEITLVTEPEIDALLQVVEEVDAFADQGDLFGVVELQPEGAGGDRRGERRQCRTLFED